jgi:hypothetical protein
MRWIAEELFLNILECFFHVIEFTTFVGLTLLPYLCYGFIFCSVGLICLGAV